MSKGKSSPEDWFNIVLAISKWT